jgi:Flp pilus assembly secretin CpaC
LIVRNAVLAVALVATAMPAGAQNAGTTIEVVALRSALPGLNGAASTTASDIASTVAQALGPLAPDLRITVAPSGTQLILAGSPASLVLAKQLIDRLDVAQKLVVLDTQVLEIDESVAKNLGLSFTEPIVSTTYAEITPPNNPDGSPQQLLGFGPLTRTPLSLGFQLNLLIQNGKGRVLANPRITTVSGRTATIRAGDTISIQTTTGGGTGTIATTQLQTFQTGVTLDITPIVNADDAIGVLLHPTVNSETGLLNGIPQISTRDTQTTVMLHDNETLIIGGLIQDSTTRNETKIPVLGDLPLIGKIFRDSVSSYTRNELVITVTPHVVVPGERNAFAGRDLPHAPALDAPPIVVPLSGASGAPPSPTAMPPSATFTTSDRSAGVAAPSASASAAAVGPAASTAADTFVYSAPPALGDASPRFLHATIMPLALRPGRIIHAVATTAGDVRSVVLLVGSTTYSLAGTANGRWETTAAYQAPQGSLAPGVTASLVATLGDGRTVKLEVPLVLAP